MGRISMNPTDQRVSNLSFTPNLKMKPSQMHTMNKPSTLTQTERGADTDKQSRENSYVEDAII